MNIVKITMAAALVTFVAAGCCPCKKYQKKYGKPLQETEWKMVQFNGRTFDAQDGYTVVFGKDNRLSGVGDCNRRDEDFAGGFHPNDVSRSGAGEQFHADAGLRGQLPDGRSAADPFQQRRDEGRFRGEKIVSRVKCGKAGIRRRICPLFLSVETVGRQAE